MPKHGEESRGRSSRLRYIGYGKPGLVNRTFTYEQTLSKACFTTPPLDRFSPTSPAASCRVDRENILHPRGGFASEGVSDRRAEKPVKGQFWIFRHIRIDGAGVSSAV